MDLVGGGAPSPLRLAFLYLSPWGHEFADVGRGQVPAHRLFGAAGLAARGHDVRSCADSGRLPWRLRQARWALRQARAVDAFVATHEAAAEALLLLRGLRLIRRPVLVMAVAATDPRRHSRLRRRIDAWLLGRADHVTVFARSQLPDLRAMGVQESRSSFLAFGVDIDFFRPSPATRRRPRHVLSVGTNEGKDFATLVTALPDDFTCTVVSDPANLAIAAAAAGDRPLGLGLEGNVPIRNLREAYAEADVLVIPLHPRQLSSGQTVLLEVMAMDRRVVVSDVPTVRDYVSDDVTCLVPSGDPAALRRALESEAGRAVAADSSPRAHVMAQDFTADGLSARIESLLGTILRSTASH